MRPLAIAALLLGLGSLSRFTAVPDDPPWRRAIGKSCLDCHGPERPKGNLNLESILKDEPERHASTWEKVVRRLRTRQMPPAGKPRPSEAKK
jgi:mono/diheme cytochrome c family protein